MIEVGLAATLFFRGAVGALAAGFFPAMALTLAWASAGHEPLSWFKSVVLLTLLYCLTFAPLSILLLPLTWMAFRRSRYRPIALLGMGLLGGVWWSVEMSAGELPLYPAVAAGVLGALSAASCFLGLREPAAPDQSKQSPTARMSK